VRSFSQPGGKDRSDFRFAETFVSGLVQEFCQGIAESRACSFGLILACERRDEEPLALAG
jgi:hypothetical protein